jgi:DNA-binding NarL/FixJ family response regulator
MTFNDSAAPERAGQASPSYRVLLINEHRILREAVRVIVDASDGFDVVGEAAGATQALQLIDAVQPDLVVTELPLPERSSAKFIAELLARRPHVAILVLSAVCDREHATAVMKAGARGYMQNDSGRVELLSALREIAAGRRYLCESFVTPRRRAREEPRNGGGGIMDLTDRQREVLRSVALGYRNRDIAHQLGVSEKAVQKHRARLCDLLDLHGTAALTLYAVRTGLVTERFVQSQ